MLITLEYLAARLDHVERELREMRLQLVPSNSDRPIDTGWTQLAETSFAQDWNNDLDAAYDNWEARRGSSP